MVDAAVIVALEKINDSIEQIRSNYDEFKYQIITLQESLSSTKNIFDQMEKRKTNNYYLEKTLNRLSVLISESVDILDKWQAEPSEEIDDKSSEEIDYKHSFTEPSDEIDDKSLFLFLDQVKHSSERLSEIIKEISIIQRNLEEFDRKFMQPNEKENNKTVSRSSSSLNEQEIEKTVSNPKFFLYDRIRNSSYIPKVDLLNSFSWNTEYFRESSSPEIFYPPPLHKDELVSLDDDVNEIIDWLQDLDTGYMIGFVTKTWSEWNIASNVFHDKRCEAMYEKKIWISVSQNVDGKNIMKNILSFFGESCEHYDYAHLLTQIEHHLKGKKYLLVLDDVGRDVSWWKKLRVGLPKESGGRVIITSSFVDTVIRMGDDNSLIYNFDKKRWRRICQQNIKALMSITEQKDNNIVSRCSSPLFIEYQIVGLDDDVNKIIKWLQEWDRGYMIGIVGMGGLGKTTIAQIVYKRCEAMYEKRIWVSVSQDFKEKNIMRSILTSLGESCGEDDPSKLQEKIKKCLTGKKYLLVLDDVWKDGQWWENLQKGLPEEKDSKIIITSRHEPTVKKMGVNESRIHKPKFLTKDESWSLLKKILISGEHLNPKLIDIGQEIAQRCAGLPLAIKAIGGIMKNQSPSIDYWTQIAENFHQELKRNDNPIDASLQLSYNELPPYLKPCFLCFSLYPEDCIIVKDQLLKWWIGEGFTNRRENERMELAEQYFMELIDRCLIEVVEKSYNRKVYTCKIHDMVRDFVIRIAKDEKFYDSNLEETRRLGFHSVVTNQTLAHLKLWALISTTRIDEVKVIPSNLEFNCGGSYDLRVLDLSRTKSLGKIEDLWSQIEKFQNLTYLSLKSTHPMFEIPDSISNLRKLQILDVSSCRSLRRLSPSISTLKCLIILDVSNCGSLEYLPKGLGELVNLEVLKGFRLSGEDYPEGSQLEELKSLVELRSLELEITTNDQIKCTESNVLLSLKKLKFLSISCFNNYGDELVKKIDNLIPPEGLHELSLKFFTGKESPSWLSPNCLPSLKFLSISFASFTHMNDRFWGDIDHWWNIIGLEMECLLDLEMKWSEIQFSMPLLQILKARRCPKLHKFPFDEDDFEGGMWRNKDEGNCV